MLLAGVALLAAACGGSSGGGTSTSSSGGGTAACATQSGAGPWGWPGDATSGFLAPHEPDVNCDGKVVVGVLSPGDTNDHGYYESFVATAKQYAAKNGWQVLTVDKINPADAVTQARNMCRQHVDMVAVAASELKDAIPVASEAVCKGTVWYVAGGQGVYSLLVRFRVSVLIAWERVEGGVEAVVYLGDVLREVLADGWELVARCAYH